jgi:phage terminase large subunit
MRILCAREIQKSIKESVHNLLADVIKARGYKQYQVLDTEIRHPNGSQFIFSGLWRNVQNIKSIEAVDVCWVEEANVCSEDTWRTLIPSIRKAGSEIWVSFNPVLKTDAAYQRFVLDQPSNALVRKVSWKDNEYLSAEFLQDMEDLKAKDYDEYLHVYEGELKQFADGAIFGKQLRTARDEGRMTSIPIESGIPVATFWDLGRNDATAIWFMQRVGHENRFIDYYEHSLVDLDHYARVLQEKGYVYEAHYLPHDVNVVTLGSGDRSRKNILESLGVRPIEVVPRIPQKMEAIELTRNKFSTCWFDEKRCERGLDALSNYQFAWDDKGETFRQAPLHNWASNGADAFQQFGQAYAPAEQYEPISFASAW